MTLLTVVSDLKRQPSSPRHGALVKWRIGGQWQPSRLADRSGIHQFLTEDALTREKKAPVSPGDMPRI